jgi:hypothetical protein
MLQLPTESPGKEEYAFGGALYGQYCSLVKIDLRSLAPVPWWLRGEEEKLRRAYGKIILVGRSCSGDNLRGRFPMATLQLPD